MTVRGLSRPRYSLHNAILQRLPGALDRIGPSRVIVDPRVASLQTGECHPFWSKQRAVTVYNVSQSPKATNEGIAIRP